MEVCFVPGTELAFEKKVKRDHAFGCCEHVTPPPQAVSIIPAD
jgi:hypothetical protein